MTSIETPLPQLLAESYPALAKYCPNLATVSQQQALFVMLDDEEAFYGGAAGGGKSDALLTAALRHVDVPGYSALLLRRTYAELEKSDGLIPRAESWLANTDAHKLDGGKKWVFPSGARLEFGHVKDEGDKHNFQSAAYQFVGFDELTSFSETVYEYIAFSRARRKTMGAIARVPIRVRSASNPGNVGHMWVKDRFITNRKRGVVFIPARVSDNPGLDVKQYRETMSHLSDALQAQLLEGDWGAFEGAAFTIDPTAHFVDAFEIPDHWTSRFESMDYGISAPTCFLAWVCDPDQNLIIFDSWYRPALPSESAPEILSRRQLWKTRLCWGDPNSLATRTGTLTRWGAPATIQSEFADQGLPITLGNDNPRAGYTRLRELLKLDPDRRFPDWHPRRGESGAPRLYVVRATCPELAEQLQSAPLTPIEKRYAGEMIDPDWTGAHGHAIAALRYGALSRPGAAPLPPPPELDPRAQWLAEHERKIESRYTSRSRFERV